MTDEKVGYKILEYIAVFVALMCVLFVGFGERNEEHEPNHIQNDTNRTMAEVKQQYEFVGSEIVVVADRIDDASKSITRAEGIAYKLNGGIKQHQERIARCTSIVIECRELIEANRDILCEAGKESGS